MTTRKPPFFKACEACDKPFKVFHSARVRRRFCSHQCKAADGRARTTVNFTCPQCGKVETLKRYTAARKRYCSARCWHAAAGFSGYRTKHGYKRRGNLQEHRVVMEQHLGRELMAGEIVHHKNGDRSDNSIGNLELWIRKDPPGQRVSDRIAAAKELLIKYGDYTLPVVADNYLLGMLSMSTA